jgi:hypothetical protein
MKFYLPQIIIVRLVVDVHIHLNILQELFEAISVTAEGFWFVEVKFLCSVNRLSHGDCVKSDRLVVFLDGSEEVFDG